MTKQTKKDKSEISMKMKIILIAIIASCYAAPGYEKSKNGLIKNDYKLLTQPQAKNDYNDAAAYAGPNAQYYQQPEKPANRGYEKPAHRGYDQPANRGYEKSVYKGYVQPAKRGYE